MNNLVVHKQFTTPKNDITMSTCDGLSIQEFLDSLDIPDYMLSSTRVYIGDIFVEQEMYKHVRPKPDAPVKILISPQGGDNNAILAMVATVALTIYAGPAGGAVASSFGLGAWGAAAITIGITIAGVLIINAMFPPPLAEEMVSEDDGSQALTIAGSRNSFRYDKNVVRVYGTVKMFPPHAAQPFTTSVGGVQYLYMLFDFGYAPLDISELKIGDTPIDNYSEVEYLVHESIDSGAELKYFTSDIDNEAVNVSIEDLDPATSKTTPTEFRYAQFDLIFGNGLYAIASDGNHVLEGISFEVTVYDDNDVLIPDANITAIPLSVANGVSYVQDTTSDFTINGVTNDGFTLTVEVRVAVGTIPDFVRIELYRASSTDNGASAINSCMYGTLRTFREGVSIKQFRKIGLGYASHTMLEMRIRATDQLNGVVDNLSCIAKSKLRKWNGVSFDAPVVTDNPAWIYADILTGTMNQRAKLDSKINWDELKRWADFCDILAEGEGGVQTKAHTCNFLLDYSITLHKLLMNVASVGRASPDIYDDMYSVIFDEEQTDKVQIFSNTNTFDFSSSRLYTEIPDAVRISFRDPESDWQMRELIVYNDGEDIDSAEIFEDIQAPMITSSDEAYRNGRYWLKQAALRKETITFKTDLEWLECKRGNLVGMQMDVMQAGGTSARVKSVVGQVVIVDTDPAMNGNAVNWFELRQNDGTIVSGPVAVYNVSEPFNVDIGINGANAGDLIVFNTAGQETYDLLIKQIDVNEDQSALITCVENVPALYDLASDPVPTYDPSLGNVFDKSDVPLKLDSITITETLTLVNKKPYITITVSYVPQTGRIPAYYRIYKLDVPSNEWIYQGTTNELSYVWGREILAVDNPIIGHAQCFSVVGVSEKGSYLEPEFGIQDCIYPAGDDTIPPVPDYFVVEDTAENFRRFWWGYDKTEEPEDLAGFVIKYTRSSLPDWSAASALHDGILIKPPFEIRALPTGTQKVMLRSIDTSGNLSSTPQIIDFAMGDRAVENVLFTKNFAPSWGGYLVSGSIDAPQFALNILSADTSTSNDMWDINDTILMFTDDDKLMWGSSQGSFRWAEEITTLTMGGITTIDQVGNGELRLLYAKGSYKYAFGDSISKPNYIETTTGMSTSGTLTIVNDLASPDGMNMAFSLANTHATIVSNLSAVFHTRSISDTMKYFSSVKVKKIGSSSGWFTALIIAFQSGVVYRLHLDTFNGDSSVTNSDYVPDDYGVIDAGDWWEIWMVVDAQFDVANSITAYLAPNWTNVIGTGAVSGGSNVVTFFGLNVKESDIYIQYNPLSSLVYNGDGQGLVPYTSPMHLEADDYTVIVESPIAVDVNNLTELNWTTDVPDINEYYEDHTITTSTAGPNGGYVITLTKTFAKVTNVSIVLQGGTAVIADLIAKTQTTIEVAAYSDTARTTRVAALVDIRVQGY